MNNLKLLVLLLPFVFIHAQQLDENFLDSLPDDVKEDILDRAEGDQANLDENYRSSLYSSKLEQAEELLELKIRLETDLLELESTPPSAPKLPALPTSWAWDGLGALGHTAWERAGCCVSQRWEGSARLYVFEAATGFTL